MLGADSNGADRSDGPDGPRPIRKSPRMRRLASQLATIQISLDPPSPPPPIQLADEEEDANALLAAEARHGGAGASNDSTVADSPPPYAWTHHTQYTKFIDSSRLLQVPRLSVDYAEGETLRQCSPPPRRCSYASTTASENYSNSLNSSYQNLLPPGYGSQNQRNMNMGYCCGSGQYTTGNLSSGYCGVAAGKSGYSSDHYNSVQRCVPLIIARSGSQSLGSDDCEMPPCVDPRTAAVDFGDGKKFESAAWQRPSAVAAAVVTRCRRGRFIGSGDFGSSNTTTPVIAIQTPPRPVSALSTPGESLGSPTMLLSPVLSRPIRSQSAHFLAMARSTSSCGCPPALAAVSASDFSDGDGTPSVAIQRASPLLAGSGTIPSLTSHSSAAAVARQLHSLPGSECFTRCPNVAYGSGGYHNATTIVSLPKAHHRHCRYYRSQRGSVSQHDSFESTGSAGSAAGQQLALPSAAAVRAVAGLPISAASAFFLQRSHSDAQESVDCRQRLRQQQSRGFQAPMGVAPKKRTVDNSQPAGSATGETAGAAAARQLDALHVQQLRRMHRQTSQRLNGFNADGLNSSLESNSGTAPYFFNVSTASAAGSAMASNGTAAPSTASLIRLRHCPLGHSDPQLYTLSAYSSVGGSPHTGHRHHQRSIGHALSGAISSAGADGGLFGYAPVDGGAAGSVAAAAFAAGAGGSRRSFLSASPLTLGRLRKDSLLLNTPRTSIGGASPAGSAASAGSSGGGRRRHHHHGHGQPHGSPGGSLVDRRHSARRSIAGDASASAVAAFGRFRLRSSTGAGSLAGGPSTSAACVAPLRQPIALRAGAHQLAASAPTGGRGDNRRWSLASLPSSSGYGTPGSNSAFSSQYSSQEHLAEMLMDFQVGGHHFDSNDSYYDELIGVAGGSFFGFRPRSRSLISPMRLGLDGDGADSTAAPILASVYKERFPKAKAQMESRLQQFLAGNAPLSGFTSSTVIAAAALASMDGQDSCGGGSGPSRATSPMSTTVPRPTGFGGLCGELGSSGNGSIRGRAHSRSASPRPTSPLLPRPISPLAVGSATAFADGVVFQNVSPVSGAQLAPGGSAGDTSLSPTSSTLNLAGAGGELKFHPALAAATQLSRDVASNNSVGSTANGSGTVSIIPVGQRSHRSSFMITAPGEQLSAGEAALLRLISDGATRFLHHQLCEIAADCLVKSREDLLTSAYFCQMSVRLDETLAEAELKVGPESYRYLVGLVRQMLMIVSRTARLLECLEFDPDEFYHLLEEAEGTVREQLGCGSARVPDLPQYIIGKLGLNKELLIDQPMEDELSRSQGPPESIELAEDTSHGTFVEAAGLMDGAAIVRAAPREEDFDTIRLISNGAYGAVYLVRHRQTRQRFALKKMKKQTLILRNQVDQVYAERDILTFTDNPFVVCFYGSFETRQHLCMLMEYVEGGDCAALLKSAGTLPIELARLYAAETVLAIEYLHSCGIVHRDLKPDNLLITTMGHIKLTDFGLSKIGLMNRTTLVSEVCMGETHQFKDNQLCGTPEYIAPCVILRQGYGKPVDWWALGIILYEFLVGIVPFMGETSEELFANIINEEVEYPEGDEALEASAESLIRMLLEKNPVDRLGTAGGAAEVVSHPFFASLDFDSLLRQKAEFVPQLENDEDTSYFDSREDRYNHEADSADDDYAPMFWSFSTASPRHSIVGLEIPSSALAGLQALAESSGTTEPSDETSSLSTKPPTRRQSAFSAVRQQSPFSLAAENSLYTATDGRLQPASGCLDSKSVDTQPIPSAVILRRRFSAARHANLSTSSSGTTATGPPTANTGSSTDSSLDAGHFGAAMAAGSQPLPRLAISPCAELAARPAAPPQRRATMAVTTSDTSIGGGYDASVASESLNELSPVEETAAGSTYSISAMLQTSQPSSPHIIPATDVFTRSGRPAMDKRPSTVSHTLLNESAGDSVLLRVGGSSLPSRSNLIRVMIPQQPQGQSQGQPAPLSNDSSYYHSYGVGGSSGGQLSPSSCRSASSVSSLDGNAAPLASSSGGDATAPPRGRSASSVLPLGQQQNLPPPAILHPQQQQQQPSSSRHQQQTKTVKMKRGPQGYGFTIRSVRVYLSEVSEYYTIEHIVAAVRDDSPAYEAGLRADDLIIYVFGQPVHNLSHPQLMHRLLSAGNGELTLHVAPLNTTSIKAGEARRVVGKLLRKKPRRPGVSGTGGASGAAVSRRTGMEKKPRKVSALLRRLSGKRTAGDIVPGTSSQKQTFMPRSVSSQDGVLAVQPSAGAIRFGQYLTTADAMLNVPYAGGPISPARASPVPMASSSNSLRHHSSFKGVNCGGDGKSPPLSASAFHQKRLSDFGIGCSASSSSPMTSTTNSSLGSGDFLHLQPMSATISGHSHQSPLVASSKSAPLPPVQDDSSNSSSIYTITAERLVTPDPNARLTPSRPTTLVQTPPSPLSKTSTGATLSRISSGFESASSVGLRQSKQSENTLSMPATSDQKLELRLSQ